MVCLKFIFFDSHSWLFFYFLTFFPTFSELFLDNVIYICSAHSCRVSRNFNFFLPFLPFLILILIWYGLAALDHTKLEGSQLEWGLAVTFWPDSTAWDTRKRQKEVGLSDKGRAVCRTDIFSGWQHFFQSWLNHIFI